MYVWPKALLGVALVVTLWGYQATALQAKDHKDHQSCGCEKPQGCPAPVIECPKVESSCCPVPTVQSHCGPPVQTGCCPVDPKDVSKAQKEALHAQHEAAEACKRRQAAIAKAQHELEEKTAKEQARIDRANDKFNKRASELQEANAKYESFYGGPSEATAGTQPQPEPEIRTKPEPTPEATPEPPTPPVVTPAPEVTPAPAPEVAPSAPVPESKLEKPKELPKTASPLDLIGLIGLLSSAGSYVIGYYRG